MHRERSTDDEVYAIAQYIERSCIAMRVSGVYAGLSIRGTRHYIVDGKRVSGDQALAVEARAFSLSCLVKPLTAMAALHSSEAGGLSLNAPLGDYLPELRGSRVGDLTVEHLISHTTGYKGTALTQVFYDDWQPNHLFEYVRNAPQYFSAGKVFNYEHSGTALLSAVLERISSAPWHEMVDNNVLAPRNIERHKTSSVDLNKWIGKASDLYAFTATERFKESASMAMTVGDLLTLCESLGAPPGGRTAGEHRAHDALFNEYVSLPRPVNGTSKDLMPVGYTMGLARYAHGVFGYDGATGPEAVGFRFRPESEVSVVLGVERGGKVLRRILLGGIVASLGIREAGPPPTAETCEFDASEIEGDYIGNDDMVLDVKWADSTLKVGVRTGSTLRGTIAGRVDRDGALVFRPKVPGEEPVFFRVPGGDEMGLMLGVCSFKRSESPATP